MADMPGSAELAELWVADRRRLRQATALVVVVVCIVVTGVLWITRSHTPRQLIGSVQPRRWSEVRAPESGVIDSIHAHDGASVQAGDILLTLQNSSLRDHAAALQNEVAALEAEASQAAADATHDSVAIAIVATRDRMRVASARSAARVSLVAFNVGTDVDSFAQTYVRGSHAGLDAAIEELDARAADLALASLRHSQWKSTYANSRTLRTLERNSVRYQLAAVRQKLLEFSIRAPFSGVVFAPRLERRRGEHVLAGHSLAIVADTSAWVIDAAASQEDILDIHPNDTVVVQVAHGASGVSRYVGYVTSIASAPIPSDRASTYRVEISLGAALTSPRKPLRPGFVARVLVSRGLERLLPLPH